jgi:poly(hydroxyalkanoate) depolymerase family esterase
MNPKISSLLALVACTALSSAAPSGELVAKTFSKKTYPDSRERQYQVYIPDTVTGSDPVPMVMVLHGCRQTERNMIDETGFKELADRENFIVVYPFITSWDPKENRNPNCWGFWFNQHFHEGAGETEDLHQIALEVESQFKIDPERRYVVGLSSGGAMSVIMAVTQSEYFAAAGAAAGLPYSETDRSVGFFCANPGTFKPIANIVAAIKAEQKAPEEGRKIPFMTIHSNNDCTVNKKGSENIHDSWIQRYEARSTAFETKDCRAEGVACSHKKYGDPKRSVVETVFYEGKTGGLAGQGTHYWVGDNFGEFANPQGPSASALFWDFFKRHPFSENRAPSISIASASVSGTSIHVNGSASDPDGTVTEVQVRLDGQHPQAPKKALGTTAWSVTFDNLPDNVVYTPSASAKDDHGATATVVGNPTPVGTPPPNQAPSVTIDAVTVNTTCITVTGQASDLEGTVDKVEVELGVRGFKPASLSSGRYSYQDCGLTAGTYTTKAKATDNGGKSTIVAGESVEVKALEVAMSNWQEHMQAGRLRVYGAPCPSVGFGACDAGFDTIFLTHSFNSFALFKHPTSNDWYLDPGRIQNTTHP